MPNLLFLDYGEKVASRIFGPGPMMWNCSGVELCEGGKMKPVETPRVETK